MLQSTTRLDGRHRVVRVLARGRWDAPVGAAVGIACVAAAALGLVAAVAGAVTDGAEVGEFVALAVLWSCVGGALVTACRVPPRLRTSTAFLAALALWGTAITVSTITYSVLGTFAHWDEALFESVAGFTTTASSLLGDPEAAARGTLLWRAGTQWLGGLAALVFVVAVLPTLGVGGLGVTDAGRRYGGLSLRSRRTQGQIRRLTGLYCALTAVGIALFLVAGMGPFDAVTYAGTTISTGGFANHAGSFGHFRSTVIEWAGIGGMFLGGMNLALLYAAVTGRSLRTLARSMELRAYVFVIVVGALVVNVVASDASLFDHENLRRTLFHLVSAASTTGHFVDGWAGWTTGAQALLVAVMGVGAMSGSAGGGFRLVRAMTLGSFLRREMVMQLHPRSVVPVRVGRIQVNDVLVGRMIGYQAQYLMVGVVGVIVLGALGPDLLTAGSVVISSLANVGPALGSLAPGVGTVADLTRPARAVLMPLMFLGRLEIAPVLVAVALVVAPVPRLLGRVQLRSRSRR